METHSILIVEDEEYLGTLYCEILDDYAVEVRYPGIGGNPSFEEAQTAYNAAQRIEKMVAEKMSHDSVL